MFILGRKLGLQASSFAKSGNFEHAYFNPKVRLSYANSFCGFNSFLKMPILGQKSKAYLAH